MYCNEVLNRCAILWKHQTDLCIDYWSLKFVCNSSSQLFWAGPHIIIRGKCPGWRSWAQLNLCIFALRLLYRESRGKKGKNSFGESWAEQGWGKSWAVCVRERLSEFCHSHPLECIRCSDLSVQSQHTTGCARSTLRKLRCQSIYSSWVQSLFLSDFSPSAQLKTFIQQYLRGEKVEQRQSSVGSEARSSWTGRQGKATGAQTFAHSSFSCTAADFCNIYYFCQQPQQHLQPPPLSWP